MFWNVFSFVIGISFGIVIGDMLNSKSFKSLFIIDE